MKMKKRKFKDYLKLGIILLGISLILWNCENQQILETNVEKPFQINAKTVSFKDAKVFFEKKQKSNSAILRKGGNPLEVNPDWNTLKHNQILYTEALLTTAETNINRKGNYNSQLYFIEVNGEMKNVIITTWEDKTNQNGLIVNARVFFNQIDGTFIDGYKIEDGKFTKRLMPRKKANVQKASFFLLFQSNGPEDCWNVDVLNEFEGGELEEVVIVANGGGGGSSNNGSTTTYYYYVNNAADYGNQNSNNIRPGGGGSITSNGITSAATAILMNPPVDADENGNCPEGYTKNPTTGECESICNGGKEYDTKTKECKCPEGKVEDSNGNCVNTPTPCETALLSRDVYNTTNGQQELGQEPIPIKLSGGWELNNTLDTSSMNLTDPSSGFNSAVYQKLVNGVYQYMYVTEGSTFEGIQDWYNNISQVSGNSEQYEISVQNAIKLNNLAGNNQLYFTGHSLGGGLASVNSLATGRVAYTYNAAGLSYETRLLYNRGYNSEIHATVVKGEIVDKIQSQFGIKAEDSDTINYIEEESTYWQDFFNERSPALNTYKAARLHFIDSVIDILDCE